MRTGTPTLARLRFLLLLVGAALLGTPAAAYYDDTHYSFNYYLARVCGYTPIQAHRLASACVSIDYSTDTEPNQYGNVFSPAAAAESAQRPRVLFHAFMDAREGKFPNCLKDPAQERLARAEIPRHRNNLWVMGKMATQRNFGPFLHFFQDESSHDGYSSWGGHWASLGAAMNTLPLGPPCDYLANEQFPGRQNVMVQSTMMWMRQYMQQVPTKQKPLPAEEGNRAYPPVLKALQEANPTPAALGAGDVALLVAVLTNKAPVIPLFDLYARITALKGGPNMEAANKVIKKFMEARGDLVPFPEKHIFYNFDAAGRIASPTTLDDFVLYGNLKIRVLEAMQGVPDGVQPAKDAEVTLKASPTRQSEQEKVFETKQLTDPAGVTFEYVPVGDYMLEVKMPNGRIKSRKLQFVKADQTLDVRVDSVDRSVLYLVDVSGSMSGPKMREAQKAIEGQIRASAASGYHDEWGVVAFGGHRFYEIHPFSQDPEAVIKAVNTDLIPNGDTPLHYGEAKALTYLVDHGRALTGMLVVLCDGDDNCPGPIHAKMPGAAAAEPKAAAQQKLLETVRVLKDLPSRRMK